MRRLISALSSAPFLRRFAGWNTIAWIAMIPIAHLTGLVRSTTFISDISLIALVLSSWSWWQAARVEVKTDNLTDNDNP